MLIEKDLKKIFDQLNDGNVATIRLSGSEVFIKVFEESSKISLATRVYDGGNFIPHSVRNSLNKKNLFNRFSIKTSFAVDENQYQIHLTYLGGLEKMDGENFTNLLEEFSVIAHAWRAYLDENDKNDHIYSRSA